MTTATRNAIEQIQRLSPAELAELQTWINERRDEPVAAVPPAPDSPEPKRPAHWPDFAARLQAYWGDAPPLAENAVIALREEERY